ncbi:MAG TPA: HNH endonuclease signature motif containing protein [Pyrinomonadaceae bacterium]|nr:HNH endonuclease signature motif containing protein [Pyrinomonadaceae bacterium]
MTVKRIVADLNAQLAAFDAEHDGLDLREKVLRLVDILKDTRSLSVAALRTEGVTAHAARERIRLYMARYVGVPLDAIELEVASGISDYARRIRELRTEQGYAIATNLTGRPDLRPNEYVLESADPVVEPHDRKIPRAVEEAVYARDHNTCVNCGWNRSMWTKQDPRFLQVHHVIQHAKRGPNTPENLVVLCNRCHVNVHAGRIVVHPPGA